MPSQFHHSFIDFQKLFIPCTRTHTHFERKEKKKEVNTHSTQIHLVYNVHPRTISVGGARSPFNTIILSLWAKIY